MLCFGGRGGRLGVEKGARVVIRPGLFSPVAFNPQPRGLLGRGVEFPIKKACAWFARVGGLYPSHRNGSP